mgnify:CR=1 FL=1
MLTILDQLEARRDEARLGGGEKNHAVLGLDPGLTTRTQNSLVAVDSPDAQTRRQF